VTDEKNAPATHYVVAPNADIVMSGNQNLLINVSPSPDPLTTSSGATPPSLLREGELESPYRGLASYEASDAPYFFGREAAVADIRRELAERLTRPRILMVAGVSGVGKSSLLRAGVLPSIRQNGLVGAPGAPRWPCVVMTPTADPLGALAVAVAPRAGASAAAIKRELTADPESFALTAAQILTATDEERQDRADAPARVLLIVDQFEQILLRCRDGAAQQAFITALDVAATRATGPRGEPPALVVAVVRADVEPQFAEFPQLKEAIRNRFLLMPMTRNELHAAIVGPAVKAGSTNPSELLHVVGQETRKHGAGALPLLSHALDQAWRLRAGRDLTLNDYIHVGGIEKAVGISAQAAYDSLSEHDQAVARHVFLSLTTVTDDGVNSTTTRTRGDLCGDSEGERQSLAKVLEAFAAKRLLILGEQTVEMSHEALLTAWPLLRDEWLAETEAERGLRATLTRNAREWAVHRDSPLYDGSRLDRMLALSQRISADSIRYPPLTAQERAFLDAGVAARHKRLRSKRLLSMSAGGAVALVVGALAVAAAANLEAARLHTSALSRQFAALSSGAADSDPAVSARLASSGWAIERTDEARASALTVLRNPYRATLTGHRGTVYSVAYGKDGILASAGGDGNIRLWRDRKLVGTFQGHRGTVHRVAFTVDGTVLVSGGADGTVRLWDVATGSQIGEFHLGGTVYGVAFSRDGTMVAGAGTSKTAQVWSTATGDPVATLTGHTNTVVGVAFNPSGTLLATTSNDHSARLWNPRTGAHVRTLSGHTNAVNPVVFNHDGGILITAGWDRTIRRWNVTDGKPIGEPLTGHANTIYWMAISPDGSLLATVSVDDTVRLWDLHTLRPVGTLIGHNGPVYAVAFTRDGGSLATAGADAAIRLWDVTGSRPQNTFTGHQGTVSAVAFGPGGRLITGSDDDTIRIWDVATREPPQVLRDHGADVRGIAFGPDRTTFVTGGWDRTVRLWDTATATAVATSSGHSDYVNGVAVNSRGTMAASASDDDTIRLWSVRGGAELGVLKGHTGDVRATAFAPQGDLLASASLDGTVRLWDVRKREPIDELRGHQGFVKSVAFSLNGKVLASASDDRTVRFWDPLSRQPTGIPLIGHDDAVYDVAYSPDGRIMATASRDQTVRLWDAATHRQLGPPLTGHTGAVIKVAFSLDGGTLASVSDDTTVRLWSVALPSDNELLAATCAIATGSLTDQQWAAYAPGETPQSSCRPAH